MSLVDYFFGRHALIVGVEDDHDGGVRIYLHARYRWIYVLIDDPADCESIKRQWAGHGGHLTLPNPPADCVFQDERGRLYDDRVKEAHA